MTAAPRRRWFRFSLRTMLVATALAALLGLQLRAIHARKEFLQHVLYFAEANYTSNPRPRSSLPFYRKWLGDSEIQRIDAWNADDAARAEELFPELQYLYFVDDRFNMVREYLGPGSGRDDWKPTVQMPGAQVVEESTNPEESAVPDAKATRNSIRQGDEIF